VTLQPDDLVTITRHAKLAALLTALTSLGVPDALADGPRPADEIAAGVGARPERVERLLRAAASEGALDHGPAGYALTAFSRQLCTSGEGALGPMMVGWSMLRAGQVALAHLDEAVRAGTGGVEAAFGRPFHAYLDAHPDEAQRYCRAMESTVESFAAGARAYDFSRFDTVVDVGGGLGGLLVAVIREHPGVHGILFDLPRVVAAAPAALAPHPESDRIDVVAGDLFHDLPRGADAYVYSTVLRCLEDDACVDALRACAAAARPGGQVLAVEMVLPEGVPPSPSGLADVYAMAVYGGKDRTEAQWADLMTSAGFGKPTFHPVEGAFVLVAATVADPEAGL
jgi:hypothetical protein